MNKVDETLERARIDAQALHKKIEAASGKNAAAMRADLEIFAAEAQKQAASLKAQVQTHNAEGKKHIEEAIAKLQDTQREAATAAKGGEEQIKKANAALLARVSSAVQKLSHAVAEKRSSTPLVRS